MSSWLEWGNCPLCEQYAINEYDTDTGETYYWHTETGQKECLLDNVGIDTEDYIYSKVG